MAQDMFWPAISVEHWFDRVMYICQVTERLSADVNDSQFYFSQVLKHCLGDVKSSLFVTNGDKRATHRAIGFIGNGTQHHGMQKLYK